MRIPKSLIREINLIIGVIGNPINSNPYHKMRVENHLVDHSEDDDGSVAELVDEDLVGVAELHRRRFGHLRQRRRADGFAQTSDVPFAESVDRTTLGFN